VVVRGIGVGGYALGEGVGYWERGGVCCVCLACEGVDCDDGEG